MIIEDKGIIINAQRFQESSLIVSCLLQNHGIKRGLIRGSKKNHGTIAVQGNIVNAKWQARLEEHLGHYTFDILNEVASSIYSSNMKLYIINSATALVNILLPEAGPYHEIFDHLNFIILNVTTFDESSMEQKHNLLKDYALFELGLLRHLGFGLDLSTCVASGSSKELNYISPKSGCAVSETAAIPYKEKLFSLPKFFIDIDAFTSIEDISNALKITGYFIEKRLLDGKKFPIVRNMFINNIA